tara:strand:+ start:446 stop:1609 length:1164 start_codon:yes stop_codon:yes gene_type:complete
MGIFDFFKSNKNNLNDNGVNTTYYGFYRHNKSKRELRERFNKKNGYLDGEYYEEFIWGDLKQKGQYKDGEKEGEWIYNGCEGTLNGESLLWKVNYKNGFLNGKFEKFKRLKQTKHLGQNSYNNQELILLEEGNCVNGLKEGDWIIYVPKIGEKKIKKNIIDFTNEYFINYENKIKVIYHKGIPSVDTNLSHIQKFYPDLNNKTPDIYLNTVSNHIFENDLETREFTTSFINRTNEFKLDKKKFNFSSENKQKLLNINYSIEDIKNIEYSIQNYLNEKNEKPLKLSYEFIFYNNYWKVNLYTFNVNSYNFIYEFFNKNKDRLLKRYPKCEIVEYGKLYKNMNGKWYTKQSNKNFRLYFDTIKNILLDETEIITVSKNDELLNIKYNWK